MPRNRSNPGRAANQPREIRASVRLALLGLVYLARAYRQTASDASAAGRIDSEYALRVRLMIDQFIELVAPRDDIAFQRGKGPAIGNRQSLRAEIYRVADRLPAYALYARLAALLDADAALYANEGSFASALARREFAEFLRKLKTPVWARGLRLFAWGEHGENRNRFSAR